MSKLNIGLSIAGSLALLLATTSVAFAQTTPVVTGIMNPFAGPAAVGSTLEMHIYSNGTVLARGAKVTSINGSSIDATQTWGSYSTSWVVNTTSSTDFVERGGQGALANIAVGDYISFSGSLDQTQSQLTVNANVVRDFSATGTNPGNGNGGGGLGGGLGANTFSGTVASVDSADMSFVLTTLNNGSVTVDTASTTVFMQGITPASFSSIAVGTKVLFATGSYASSTETLMATRVYLFPMLPVNPIVGPGSPGTGTTTGGVMNPDITTGTNGGIFQLTAPIIPGVTGHQPPATPPTSSVTINGNVITTVGPGTTNTSNTSPIGPVETPPIILAGGNPINGDQGSAFLGTVALRGTVTSAPGATAPTTFTFTSMGNVAYTVNVLSTTKLLSSKFVATTLSNIAVGNIVTISGSVVAGSTSTVNAVIVQDQSL